VVEAAEVLCDLMWFVLRGQKVKSFARNVQCEQTCLEMLFDKRKGIQLAGRDFASASLFPTPGGCKPLRFRVSRFSRKSSKSRMVARNLLRRSRKKSDFEKDSEEKRGLTRF
jgi:hypothetical protein